jgi:hypothetical protein
MTQEDKDLLLKDLCVRLNTNLACSIYRTDDYGVGYRDEILTGYCKGDIWYEFYFGDDCGIGIDNVSKIKPYLFPLSSMTKEQSKIYHELIGGMFGTSALINFEVLEDFFHKNHLDYRGLIEKGLAIDATNLNVY